jgi:hypothetical protein
MPFGPEPECGQEKALLSGRAVYVLGLLHLSTVPVHDRTPTEAHFEIV